MSVEQVFKFKCDALGCTNTLEKAKPELADDGTWCSLELEEGEVHGCCKIHLGAALLVKLGFEEEAKGMIEWARNTKGG